MMRHDGFTFDIPVPLGGDCLSRCLPATLAGYRERTFQDNSMSPEWTHTLREFHSK